MVLSELFESSTMRAGTRLPWGDPAFSERMLREHLDDRHDLASRRGATIDGHVRWLNNMIVRPARVLDLGCGPGLYAQLLAGHGHTCVGVDVSPSAIRHAEAEAVATDAACSYRLADLRDLGFEGEFDLVLLLYGELNKFEPAQVVEILGTIRGFLAADGRAIVELSTEQGYDEGPLVGTIGIARSAGYSPTAVILC